MVITKPDEIPTMMAEWPTNTSKSPALDDENSRLDTEKLAEWWLSTPRDSYVASITSEQSSGKQKVAWHFWFELTHRDHVKPCRCFRILIQHEKPPRIYQLQFPMEMRELPETADNSRALKKLLDRTEELAAKELPRDTVANKNIKSINMDRRFSPVQLTKFQNAVDRFVSDLNTILTVPTPAKRD